MPQVCQLCGIDVQLVARYTHLGVKAEAAAVQADESGLIAGEAAVDL